MEDEKMTNGFSDFIIGLSVNKADEDREQSRARLQQQFEACDSRMIEMVKDNRRHLSNTVEVCSRVIHSVNNAKTRCQSLKYRITRCMDMLQFNRDNIRRMWLESLEHKYVHKIFSEIEDLRAAPKQVKESLISKKLEHATEVLVSSVRLLDGNLCNANALKDLRFELHTMQENLYQMILDDLKKSLHFTDFISEQFGENLKEITYDDVFSNKIPKSDYFFRDLVNKVNLDEAFVTVLLNSLQTMKRLPDAMEYLKENCQMELTCSIQELSKLMIDIVLKSTDSPLLDLPIEKQHIFLVDLVESAIYCIQKIIENYERLFIVLRRLIDVHAITDVDFQMEDVYSKIQVAIENFLSHYFEINSSLSQKDTFTFENSGNFCRINSFFSSQNEPDDKSLSLFKFSNSSHSINVRKFSRETKIDDITIDSDDESEKASKPVLVCRPSPRNIILIYKYLKSLISDIEKSLNLSSDEHCPLHSFLHDSAILFLDHVNSDINRMLKNAYANLDAWNTAPADDISSFKSGSEREVLSCSLILNNLLEELKNLMFHMPDYSTHFLRLLYYVILDYKDMYNKVFKQVFEEDQNILSVSWARDSDIRRLMKSFLNWRHLEDDETSIDVIESPEEIRLRNKEESDLLIRNLSSEDEMSWEIITNPNKLTNLALLQENLIWFSMELLKFIKHFNQSQPNSEESSTTQRGTLENNPTNIISGLRKVIKEYEDFADMCLLALHLEVRARCFHYLQTFSVKEICVEGNFIQELDTAVKNLTSDLLQTDGVLLPILTPKEFKYVFEGLGELVASLMILIASNMNKINEVVVSKIDRYIFNIQCCLANITMAREVSLERARQFIDLLKSTHQEILDQIVEEGLRFNEQEYTAVFKLISSSTVDLPRESAYYLEKLKLTFQRLASKTKN